MIYNYDCFIISQVNSLQILGVYPIATDFSLKDEE